MDGMMGGRVGDGWEGEGQIRDGWEWWNGSKAEGGWEDGT